VERVLRGLSTRTPHGRLLRLLLGGLLQLPTVCKRGLLLLLRLDLILPLLLLLLLPLLLLLCPFSGILQLRLPSGCDVQVLVLGAKLPNELPNERLVWLQPAPRKSPRLLELQSDGPRRLQPHVDTRSHLVESGLEGRHFHISRGVS